MGTLQEIDKDDFEKELEHGNVSDEPASQYTIRRLGKRTRVATLTTDPTGRESWDRNTKVPKGFHGFVPDGGEESEATAEQVVDKRLHWGTGLLRPWTMNGGNSKRVLKIASVDDKLGRQIATHYLRARDYRVSRLRVFAEASDPAAKNRDTVRLALYSEAMNGWRLLTDVRFRLMALLPAISIVAFLPLGAAVTVGNPWVSLVAFILSLLGLCITHGLHIYDERNDGLYNDMISRARRIEAELGVDTGIMLGRLKPVSPRVDHQRATNWVYRSVKTAWLVVSIALLASTVVFAVEALNDGGANDQETMFQNDENGPVHS